MHTVIESKRLSITNDTGLATYNNTMLIKRKIIHSVCYVVAVLLVGCGSLQEKNVDIFTSKPGYDKAIDTFSGDIKGRLYTQYHKWRGVRYRLGGSNKRGIDCSAFVQVTFKTKLGVNLPRTTSLQSRLGKEVRKNELKAGDLVFFRTGSTSRHVGIYLEENKFLHASQSRGVTISKLDNTYWQANYWKSVRI